MRNPILVPILLATLAFAGCGGGVGEDASPESRSEGLGKEFVLRYGESIDVGPLMLQFVAVTEDSRCPIDLTCVWSGNARIQLAASTGSLSDLLELNMPLQPRVAVFAGHIIELRRLDPPPSTASPSVMMESYKATLVVDGQVTGSGS